MDRRGFLKGVGAAAVTLVALAEPVVALAEPVASPMFNTFAGGITWIDADYRTAFAAAEAA